MVHSVRDVLGEVRSVVYVCTVVLSQPKNDMLHGAPKFPSLLLPVPPLLHDVKWLQTLEWG